MPLTVIFRRLSHFSADLYNFEMEEEEQEDEDAIIEKRRLQRLAILQKYQGTTSNAPSIATSLVSQSPSADRSDSEDSDAVEKLATEDLEKEIALANSQTRNELKDAVKEKESKQDSEAKSGVGDMFADDDMFSDNYSVSTVYISVHIIWPYQSFSQKIALLFLL